MSERTRRAWSPAAVHGTLVSTSAGASCEKNHMPPGLTSGREWVDRVGAPVAPLISSSVLKHRRHIQKELLAILDRAVSRLLVAPHAILPEHVCLHRIPEHDLRQLVYQP